MRSSLSRCQLTQGKTRAGLLGRRVGGVAACLQEVLHKHPRSKLPTCLEFKAFLFKNRHEQRSELCKRSYQRVDASPEFEVLAAEELTGLANLGFLSRSQPHSSTFILFLTQKVILFDINTRRTKCRSHMNHREWEGLVSYVLMKSDPLRLITKDYFPTCFFSLHLPLIFKSSEYMIFFLLLKIFQSDYELPLILEINHDMRKDSVHGRLEVRSTNENLKFWRGRFCLTCHSGQ